MSVTRTLVLGSIVVLVVGVACSPHAPNAYEGGGRGYPILDIEIACSNGTPDGQSCMSDFNCCSGHCLITPLATMGGLCVQCETDSDCERSTMMQQPFCDTNTYRCVSAPPGCGMLGAMCTGQNPCCTGFDCVGNFCMGGG